jgi:hypothetical protein
MLVTRRSPLTGEINTLDLDVTQEQLDLYATGTVHLQNAFPALAPSLREFIKTGYTPADWDALFGPGCSALNDRAQGFK